MNTGAPPSGWPELGQAERRVLEIQAKLHRWAGEDEARRFDDLFNLVTDPAFLMVAWERVRTNKGARTAGVDGQTAHYIRVLRGEEPFLAELRADVKAGAFTPLPVRERMIPKSGGRLRRLGIPTVRDRVVQAALKLVLEPIFEAGFRPCSYGFRPRRRTHDAIAEIRHFGAKGYEWVLEADIEACFDSIDHAALMDRVRRRVGDKRVLALVKAFLKAGVLSADTGYQETSTGTPQGGILSPLLANIALSALDDWFVQAWQDEMGSPWRRHNRLRTGRCNWRLVRYADDFVVMVAGGREHAEELRETVAAVLARIGLRLSGPKTQVVHLDEGFDFLGWHIQRRRQQGSNKRYVYTYPAKKALASIVGKVRTITRRTAHAHLSDLLQALNPTLAGWCNYFRHGVSNATFGYLSRYAWRRVLGWIRKRHDGVSWKHLIRRYLPGWKPTHEGITLFDPQKVAINRYRYRGTKIPTPWDRWHQPAATTSM
ncbi:group II intron reverse transcriptase/maturase [Micromonospora sp. NPDC005299]|uniref:group II intron reverse transcriptase/maturase n=1 Tax=Micromonospora sp. NPDC005299 TaxID=3364231 RepID=UPI0036867B3A